MFEFPNGGNILQETSTSEGTCHLTTLSGDSSLKGEDKRRISGYLKKWSDTKIIIGVEEL